MKHKLIKSFLISTFVLTSMLVTTPTYAMTTSTHTEVEGNESLNDTFATAEDLGTISDSCKYTISGEQLALGFGKADIDTYKIHFDNAGGFTAQGIDTLMAVERDVKVNVYNSDMKKVEQTLIDGTYTHKANSTFYITVGQKTSSVRDNTGTYNLIINEDETKNYEEEYNDTPDTALVLKESTKVIGHSASDQDYFKFSVPKGYAANVNLTATDSSPLDKLYSGWKIKIISKDNKVNVAYNAEPSVNIFKENGDYVLKEGNYTISINSRALGCGCDYILSYTLKDITAPKITGVANNKTYKKAVTIKFSDVSGIKTATLNNKSIKSGCKVSKKGNYTLKVKDKEGNLKSVKFKIK